MRTTAAMGVLLAALAVAIEIPNLPSGRVPSEDAGAFFYIAQRILDGGVPYRDVWDHKPPGVYLVDTLGLAIAGPLGAWFVQLAVLVGAALLGLRTLASFGPLPALAGSIAWLLAAPRLFLADGTQTTYAELYGLPLQFAMLGLAAAELERPRPSWRAAAIGALAALTVLFKPTLAGTALAAAIVFAVTAPRLGIVRIGAMTAAGAAVLAIACVPFALSGALGEAFDQVVRYNLVYSAFASPLDRAAAIAAGLRLTLPSGLAAVSVAAWSYAVVTRRARPTVLLVALVALPLELVLASAGRGYHYYFLAWLPAMAVLTAFAAREVERRVNARVAVVVLTAALLAMSVRPAMLVARLAGVGDDGLVRAGAGYVSSATRPGEPVLVWGSRVEVLTLADRESPTRYVYQYAALATRGYATAARVDEFIAELERHPPALIVDASRDSFVTPPLDRAAFAQWTSPEPQYAPLPEIARVIAFVEERYERSGTIPGTGWTAWRLRGR